MYFLNLHTRNERFFSKAVVLRDPSFSYTKIRSGNQPVIMPGNGKDIGGQTCLPVIQIYSILNM